MLGRALDRHIQQRNETFAPFQRKALRAQKALLQELFKDHGVGQLGENPQLFFAVHLQAVLGPFHPVGQPLADAIVVDVHELHADLAAVGVPHAVGDLAQGPLFGALDCARRELHFHVLVGEAVVLGIEFRLMRTREPERIERGNHVAAHAIGANQLIDAI